ncbi:hypothetical protein IGI04_014884 [Brassica rapa subsp. trilocularis]|uniref:Uncharacterized protein n=1 Tax=Brassica rapa subsp. trilocularis TaxID=1813537 RepID=A0ABQ7MNG3_BRACM|nr:hypothetical protein IGI04_014884 [Brassica rapa subsp. trilocularis]
MDGFTKRVLRILIKKAFDEAYFTHRLWMFFRETKVTVEDIRRVFHQVREKMKHMITLTKKRASVSILPRIMADQLGGIIRDLEVQIGNALVPVDFHVLDIELNWNSSLLLGRSFLATVGAVCDMNNNKLCLTLIDPNIHNNPIQPKTKVINYVDYRKELGFIGACHCGAEYESEYETEYSESIDTPTFPSIDSNESTVTDDRNNTSLDVDLPVDHFAPPNHCYPHFVFQPPSKRGCDDYSIGSWADSGFHESFAVDTVFTSPNEEHTEEYDEDYWKERAIEMSLQDERFETHKFTNTFPTSFDEVHSTSVDTHPRPAKQPFTSIDTHTGTSIDIRAAAKIQEQENIPSPTRFINTYLKRFAPLKPPPHTKADTQAEKTNTLPSTSTGKSMKSNHLKNTSSAEITLPSIDTSVSTSIDTTLNPNLSISKLNDNANIDYGFLTPDEYGIFRDPDGNVRAIDGRILQVSREDIADILQVANGPDNLYSQQRGTPAVIQTEPNNHVGVATKEINPDLSYPPKGQASIDGTTETLIDRVTSTSNDKDDPTSIDKRYECGNRAFDMYGARKFTWERRDEKLLERASLFEESYICLPEHVTSFTLTRLAPELYTKDEINEMVTGISGDQEKLGEELKSLVEDTHHPLDRGYNELFRSMVEMRTEIESLRQQLEKEATTSTSIDAPHAPSIDVSLPTAQIPAEPQCSAKHKDEWEVSYIDTRIYPLNNNVDWLSTKIELLQQDLDTICKKDQQPATSIDVCTITSLDAKVSAMNERLRTYEDMHDRVVSPVMLDLNKLSSQIIHAQRDIDNITNQKFLQANSSSIDRLRGPWIEGKYSEELLPYTAAEVDKITSKIYTAIDTMEERLDKRCDDIYFPFDNRISGLDSHAEWLQKEVKAIQRQLAAQHQISASIDMKRAKSLDDKSPRSTDEHIIASIDAESTPAGKQLIHKTIESMRKELTELSAYAYDNIGWHQVSIDNVQDRLQNISNVLEKMDDKWTRNDEATRNSTIDAKADQPINYTLALKRMK